MIRLQLLPESSMSGSILVRNKRRQTRLPQVLRASDPATNPTKNAAQQVHPVCSH